MTLSTPFRPPVPQALCLTGPAGELEALLEVPAEPKGPIAVICHPHPLFGGTMQNKVVHMSARALQEAGFITLRFNFRGVGTSAGKFDDGVGETEDALAAVDWLQQRFPHAPLALVGFSFGSFIAYRVSNLRCVSHLVTIAPPISRFDFARLPAPRVPWLVVQGDRDELVDYASVCSWAQSIAPAPEMATIADGEHFFHGKLNELKTVVQQFVTR